jgi:hypothetical protein
VESARADFEAGRKGRHGLRQCRRCVPVHCAHSSFIRYDKPVSLLRVRVFFQHFARSCCALHPAACCDTNRPHQSMCERIHYFFFTTSLWLSKKNSRKHMCIIQLLLIERNQYSCVALTYVHMPYAYVWCCESNQCASCAYARAPLYARFIHVNCCNRLRAYLPRENMYVHASMHVDVFWHAEI